MKFKVGDRVISKDTTGVFPGIIVAEYPPVLYDVMIERGVIWTTNECWLAAQEIIEEEPN